MRKIISLLVCAVLLLCSCTAQYTDSSRTSFDTTADCSLYDDIIEDYRNIVTFRVAEDFENYLYNGDFIELSYTLNDSFNVSKSDIDAEIHYKWSNMIIEMPDVDSTENSFGYVLTDINNDSSPELFWVRDDHTVLAVFTVHNNHVILLDAFWTRYVCSVTENGMLYTQSSGGADIIDFKIRELSGDSTLTTVTDFSIYGDEYSERVNGEYIPIDKVKFDKLIIEHPFENSQRWLNTEITPLFNS